MIAVDTNVVIRLLTQDDPKQSAAARSLFRSGANLDCESSIRDAFTKLLGLKNVH
jgi:predicted nucleic-acid-binding protein